MDRYKVYSLDSLITSDKTRNKLSDVFNSFNNSKDKREKIKKFLVDQSIRYNEHNLAKTYLLLSNNDELELYGFFTISLKPINIKELSNSQKKSLLGNVANRDKIEYAPAYLIAQIGKNEKYDCLHKYEIMDECREQIQNVVDLIGGRIVILECEEKLIEYYEENGFILYSEQKDEESNLYTMYQRFDKWIPRTDNHIDNE